MEVIPQLILVLFLVLLNGYFVASEFSLVSVRKTRIQELVKRGNKTATLIQKALNDLDSYLSATQLGITIASLSLGWVGEPAIAQLIGKGLTFLPEGSAFVTSHTLAIAVAFSIITFLHIVLGELAPKTLALQRAESTSLFIIGPLIVITKIFKPFILLLNGAGALVLKLFNLPAPKGQLVHSEEEIQLILMQSEEGGVLEKNEAEMVRNALKLDDLDIEQIMVPKKDVIAFQYDTTLAEIFEIIEDNFHSRFPVYLKTIDKITGFVHIKDIYQIAMKLHPATTIGETKIIRTMDKVTVNHKADDLLLLMRKNRAHMQVVVDKNKKTLGIITLEDIVEKLVGEIGDEFDKPE